MKSTWLKRKSIALSLFSVAVGLEAWALTVAAISWDVIILVVSTLAAAYFFTRVTRIISVADSFGIAFTQAIIELRKHNEKRADEILKELGNFVVSKNED